ncbi:transposase [Burkholderia humptydooensis]|nr:transposase [Burkholderia humptydooensis]
MMQPSMSTFDDPTDFSKATTVRLTAPRDAGGDVALVKDASVFVVVVTTVGVDAGRTAQRPSTHAADRHNGLDQRNQLGDVVTIGAGQDCRDRRSVGVGGDVVLRPGSSSIGGVRASFSPAPTARIDDESTTTREKSIFSAARSFASSTACSRSHTPACCQSRSLRQQLTPEPHPISDGKSRQRMPVFSTKRMPVKAARSATGLRPGYLKRRGFGGGSSASISAHSSSSMIGLPISLARLSRRPRLTGC